MATLTIRALEATPDLIVVDKAKASSGESEIDYDKADKFEELWERTGSSSFTFIDVQLRMSGRYTVTLKPGQIYEVAIFQADHGPLSTDPIMLMTLKVFCLWKAPTGLPLITDQNSDTGGTWHWHQIHTKVPT